MSPEEQVRLIPAQPSWFRRYRIVTLLAINLLLFLFIGFTVEIALRVVPPSWLEHRMAWLARGGTIDQFGTDRSWKTVEENGQFLSFKPHSQFDIIHAEYQNIATIDELGGRQLEPQLDGLRLLPCLGDSFTFGVGVENGETFVNHLQQSVGVRHVARLINLGVPGSALPTQRSIVERRQNDFANPPTYLVFFFLGNDFSDLLRDVANEQGPQMKPARNEKKSAWRDISAKINAYVSASWLRHCYAIQFSKRTLMRLTNETRRNPIFDMMESTNTSYHRRVREALRSELAAWREMGQGDQFDIVVIFIPDCHQVIPTRREELARYCGTEPADLDPLLPNRILAETLEEQGISYIDPTNVLIEMENTEGLYYVHDNHFTAEGHRRFAQIIGGPLEATLSN